MARSIKKGPFVDDSLLKRVEASNKAGQKQMIKTYSRSSVIIPDMVGFTISVYNNFNSFTMYLWENVYNNSRRL